MSNHSGSYILNAVIEMLDRRKFFQSAGHEESQRFVLDLVKMATQQCDYNSGKILEGFCEKFGLCYCCLATASTLTDGLCPGCLALLNKSMNLGRDRYIPKLQVVSSHLSLPSIGAFCRKLLAQRLNVEGLNSK